MRIQKASEAVRHLRPYGDLLLLAGNTTGKMLTRSADLKILKIRPGESTSHHFHLQRESIYHVLEGRVRARSLFSNTKAELSAGDTVIVGVGEDHMFTCLGQVPASVIELESPPHDRDDKFPVNSKPTPMTRPLGRFWTPCSGPRLKICGVRSLDVAYACSELGVHAIGLHAVGACWQNVTSAADWVDALPDSMSIALLTDLEEPPLLDALLCRLRCDTLQIQGHKSPTAVAKLARFAHEKGIRVIKSIAVPPPEDVSNTIADIAAIEPHVDAILLDSHWRGGTGQTSDVGVLLKLCPHIRTKLVIAGGIAESNISTYLHSLTPFAFDVESSVEWLFSIGGRRVTAKSVPKIASLVSTLFSTRPNS